MKYSLFLITCFCCFSCGFSQDKSNVEFVIRNVGIGVDGHFNTFNIETKFDDAGRLLNIKGEIKVASIETGIESRDKHLLKEAYFDVENYDTITLVSKKINIKSANLYHVTATLTIKGKTKVIPITLKLEKINNRYKLVSNFDIDRSYFNVGGRSFVMSNTVEINVVHYHNL